MSDDAKFEEAKSFVSGLGTGREGFHSEITEYALKIGERTSDDFIRHFSPAKIMDALAARPTERARIIAEATGVHDRVAHKMSPENSGEALQIALEEKVTTTADIVRLFQPDDRQRYLERKALWKFAIEGEPWKVSSTAKPAYERAKAFIAYVLQRGLQNMLVSHDEVVDALTVQRLAEHLPREQLANIISAALKKDEKFNEVHLLEAVPPAVLVKHVPLEYIWTRAVVPLIAERHEYAEPRSGGAMPDVSRPEPSRPGGSRPDNAKPETVKADNAKPKDKDKASLTSLKADSAPKSGAKVKGEEPGWTVAPAPEKSEEDELVGEDEIMDDAL